MKTEEEKLKKKLKINNIVIITLLVVLLIILCISIIRIFHIKDGLNNNDSNMGLATQSDKLTFYYDYDKGLIKKDKEEKVLTKDQAYSINYYDGVIFYTTPSSTGGINIKKVNIDGKGEKVILSTKSSSTKMYLQDSKIYYLTSNPDTISRMDLDGKNQEVLLQRSVTDFKVIDEKIYFSDIMGFLYSIDTKGENYKTIIEESLFNKFQILDKYVYYFDSENSKLMKINLDDTTKKEEVVNELDCDIYNVTTNGIFYFNQASGTINYVSLNGKKTREIIKTNTDNTKINVVGTTIYYIDFESGKKVTRLIGINGKQIK